MKISSVPKMGSMGSHVATYQAALHQSSLSNKDPKLDPGTVDGIFGAKTKEATSHFQKTYLKTTGTGVPGPLTLAGLGLVVEAVNPVSGRPALTKEVAGSDRHLHPAMRLLIEGKVFPNGKIEGPHWMKETADIDECTEQVLRAMADLKIWEKGGNNMGVEVGYIQGTTGSHKAGGNGDAWCEDWDQTKDAFIEDVFQEASPKPATAGVMDCLSKSRKVKGLVVTKPRRGATALAEHGTSGKGHSMPIVDLIDEDEMLTCEGNTSVSNIRDGDGSGLKTRNIWKNGDLVTRGFVLLYPDNILPSVKKAQESGSRNTFPPQTQNPPPPATSEPTSAPFVALWDGKHKDANNWTQFASDAIDKHGQKLLAMPSFKDAHCPSWPSLDRTQRKQILITLISSMTKPESGFKPATKYTEDFNDSTGKSVISRGLLQISIESSNSYLKKRGMKLLTNAELLHDPKLNLEIGVMILDDWITRDGYLLGSKTIVSTSRTANVGAGRYWSCCRPMKSKNVERPSYKEIAANVLAMSKKLSA